MGEGGEGLWSAHRLRRKAEGKDNLGNTSDQVVLAEAGTQ
jgi:hypothetical protein